MKKAGAHQVVVHDPMKMEREVLLRCMVLMHRPDDMPNRPAVVRGRTMYRQGKRFVPDEPDVLASVFPSLRAAREAIPPGMVSTPRAQHDEPCVVEVWM